MIIEKLKKKDLVSYKHLIDECFDGSNSIEYYKEKYDENNQNYEILVAKDEDKIVGSVTIVKLQLFTFSFQPALEIFNVAVLKKYRGRKIAKELLNNIISYAKDNGYKSLVLTCLDTAHDAHYLYESVGFKKTSSIKYNLHLE